MNQGTSPGRTGEELAFCLVAGVSVRESAMLTKALTFRAPVTLIVSVDAMADQSQVSRNEMLNKLVTVGLETVGQMLDEPTARILRKLESLKLAELGGDYGSKEA